MPTRSPKLEIQELRHQVDTLRRRAELAEATVRVLRGGTSINLGPISLDMMKHTLTVDGEIVKVTPTEYQILEYLALNAVETHVTLTQIKASIGRLQMTDGSTQFHLAMIREHLGPHRQMLRRIRGKGFQLVEDDEEVKTK